MATRRRRHEIHARAIARRAELARARRAELDGLRNLSAMDDRLWRHLASLSCRCCPDPRSPVPEEVWRAELDDMRASVD